MNKKAIVVGLTTAHGMTQEAQKYPPAGVEYRFMKPKAKRFRCIQSPIKASMLDYEHTDEDLIESVICPLRTKHPWIYSLESMPPAAAFNFLGCPIPRAWRMAHLKRLFLAENCRKLVFWSEAGFKTMSSYGGITDQRILDKSCIVYPSIRKFPDERTQYFSGPPKLLFSGDFFRKGGVHVVDAFERFQKRCPDATLWVCSDEKIDFNTPDVGLKNEFLEKIRCNPGIRAGRVPRDKLITEILPQVDAYLLPAYAETFGFALLEAMAFGIPVIASQHFAIPEIVDDQKSGFLIDFEPYQVDRFCKGYVVLQVPQRFRDDITNRVYDCMTKLLESTTLRERMGRAGRKIALTRFSHETRNRKMKQIYLESL